jgi:hypothetical protein
MKAEVLGLNHLLSFFATDQTVSPPSSAVSSVHFRMAPPNGSSVIPRCSWYHAFRAAWSPVLLKNTPPIPVTFAIDSLDQGGFHLPTRHASVPLSPGKCIANVGSSGAAARSGIAERHAGDR